MSAPSRASSRRRPAAAAAGSHREKVYGAEAPRIFTKPLHQLEPRSAATEKWTLGYDVIDFAEQVLGVSLYPWQRWVLIHMLELLEDGSLRFRQVVLLVGRQNGKSLLSQVLALWFMVVWGWPLVLGTAQDLDQAEEVWEGAVELVEDNDELAPLVRRVTRVNGKKAMSLANNTRWKVKAANAKAGRGLSGNLILLDELRTHQNWDAWGAITYTTMAQDEWLLFGTSNAGDLTSVVLRNLRLKAHEALGDPDGIVAAAGTKGTGPTQFDLEGIVDVLDADGEEFDEDLSLEDLEIDDDSLGLFEYSAPPNCDRRDKAGWAQACPSLNWKKGFTERNIASRLKDPEWVFRTEVLCQWPDGTLEGPFPPGAWEKGQNTPVQDADGTLRSRDEDKIVGLVDVSIDTSFDRSHTYVTFAGLRADGAEQAVVVAGRYGQDWVRGWLMDPERRPRIRRVTGQSRGAPVSGLIRQLKDDPTFDVEVVDQEGADLLEVFSTAFDAVRDNKVRHNVQPALDLAAATAAVRTLSADAKVFDRRHSPADAAPLVSWAGALWLLHQHVEHEVPPPPKPQALSLARVDSPTADLRTVGF